ncbi:MAG: FAD-binding oxidoreductase [Deinococcales bacterium]
MTAKRGYHAMLPEPGFELDYPVMSGSRVFVMTPLAEGLRLAGTAEFARLDAEPNYRRARVLVEHARHYFPDLRADNFDEWMGQRPMMADSVPVISRSPSRPNVIYAYGHGHYGLTQGPTTGRLVADLVQGRDAPIDLAPYRFDRFR